MKNIFVLFLFLSISVFCASCSSSDTTVIAFYNFENLFDAVDDSLKNDSEFLPESRKQWTNERLKVKMANLSVVIKDLNADILGFCETENEAVVKELNDNYLSSLKYDIAYLESPDGRGIDVGMYYNSEKFSLISVTGDTVPSVVDLYPTRLVLYVKLKMKDSDTHIHCFVNHWPSRRGDGGKTELYRINAALTLKKRITEIFSIDPQANVVSIGDYNDEPENISIKDSLAAFLFYNGVEIDEDYMLFNISYSTKREGKGTYNYQGQWNQLDQMIISKNLLGYYVPESFTILKEDYLLQKGNDKYTGTPFPTYGGNKYLGGYSDHLPIKAVFLIK